MYRLLGTASLAAMLTIGLAACGDSDDGNTAASDSPSVIVSPPAGFTPEAKYTDMCAAFNDLAASPQAAVLADDSASQDDVSAALSVITPQLQTFVSDYGSVMPPQVATDFSDWVTELDSVSALNENSSFTDAAKALKGLAELKTTGSQLDSFTESACGTSLGF